MPASEHECVTDNEFFSISPGHRVTNRKTGTSDGNLISSAVNGLPIVSGQDVLERPDADFYTKIL